jgi:C4-type Zn-finger protein
MMVDTNTEIPIDTIIVYTAAFSCGHRVCYEAPNGDDIGYLRKVASQRLCPECAYKQNSSMVLQRREAR